MSLFSELSYEIAGTHNYCTSFVVLISLITFVMWNGFQGSRTLIGPIYCGCSEQLSSIVPCLVSVTEDIFKQKVSM